MNQPKAYSYVRFSTPEQGKGDSYRRQTESSRTFALGRGLELDETLTFQDLGVSAYRGRNAVEGALGSFIDAVDSGRIARGSFLLVESLDRLSRDTVTRAFSQLTALLGKGIHIATLQDGRVFTSDSLDQNFGELLVSLSVMYRAHEESLTKGKRVSAAWSNKRERARVEGHKLTATCPAWLKLNPQRTNFEVIPERVRIVQRVFELTLDGVGKGRVAAILNSEGIPTFRKSQGWHPSYIQKLLDSEAVIGTYQPMRLDRTGGRSVRLADGDSIRDYFPAIIDEEAFLKARQVRTTRRVGGGRKGRAFSNLLSGIARCGVCGGPMHYVAKKERELYLKCSNARRSAANCHSPSWQYRATEAFVLLSLREVDYRDLFPSITAKAGELIRQSENELLLKESAHRRAQSSLEAVIRLLIERPDSGALKSKLDELEGEIAKLAEAIRQTGATLETERARLAGLGRDQGQLEEALAVLARAHREQSPQDLFLVRSRLNQALKKVVRAISFFPATTGQELFGDALFGRIVLTFHGADAYSREIWVILKQREAYGFKSVEGKRSEQTAMRVGGNQTATRDKKAKQPEADAPVGNAAVLTGPV
ncbi:Uncharacterised protein [Starkeya nomas]|uniref:Uncharacterized protein n=1 Tax=Starkeya nomas TaxID=2666134 RepID=A0A5S9PZG2_9HYPH|nr:recombinase family protein [Starkeya nomas]CAA0110550.1 Uncharacterised protein [Starkeya nomas]